MDRRRSRSCTRELTHNERLTIDLFHGKRRRRQWYARASSYDLVASPDWCSTPRVRAHIKFLLTIINRPAGIPRHLFNITYSADIQAVRTRMCASSERHTWRNASIRCEIRPIKKDRNLIREYVKYYYKINYYEICMHIQNNIYLIINFIY